MSILSSPNMMLPIPVVGSEAGPTYAQDVNNSLTIIDGHTHSAGSGVQITPTGLNINSDLSIGNNNLVTIKSTRFQPQVSALIGASDLGCLYEVGVDLYYNDGAGNNVRITQGGNVAGAAGTITGLPSGTASAAFTAGTFVFQASTNTGANIDGASFILRNNSANSKGLTLQPPSAMGADYAITLPSLPAQTNVMSLDTSGNMGSITYNQVGTSMGATGANAILHTATVANFSCFPTITAGGVGFLASAGNESNQYYTIAGSVSALGVQNGGVGFTASRNSVGNYTISFNTAFTTAWCMATIQTDSVNVPGPIMVSRAPLLASAVIQTFSIGGTPADFPFSFFVVGNR